MKVIAINGSPRKDGNIGTALQLMAEELAQEGIETEIVQIGQELIHGCMACGWCSKDGDDRCVIDDDVVNAVSQKMRAADGIILGSPTYYGGIAGAMKSFLDRVFYSSMGHRPFRNKVATAVASVRRAGGVEVFNQLCHYLKLGEAILPPSQYWGVVYGAAKGEATQDAEGLQIVRRNANAMAWLMKAVRNSNETLPRVETFQRTNFIR